MNSYEVAIKEIHYGKVTVNAENEEEARLVAEESLSLGITSWGDVDIEVEEVREV